MLLEQVAVLLLGGKGERFSSTTPKQFITMGQTPLFIYAAKALEASKKITKIVYVYPDGYLDLTKNLLAQYGLSKKPCLFVLGGDSRQESCFLGLSKLKKDGLSDDSLVIVLDGDRPNLTQKYIDDNLANALEFGASVTAIKSSDSVAISKVPALIDGYIPRNEVYLLQTPQAFRFSLLFEAEEEAKKTGKKYTDEGSLVLALRKVAPRIVEGDKANIKITVPEDLNFFLGGKDNDQ